MLTHPGIVTYARLGERLDVIRCLWRKAPQPVIVDPMKRRKPSFSRALLLLLVAVGPLQAQAVFACAMMETMVQDECCCEDHEAARGCEDSDCSAALQSRDKPCCEYSVEITADPDARHDGPISKPVEVRSGVDPPHALISSFDFSCSPQALPTAACFHSASAAGPGGSNTYLVTQRLRI